MNICLPIRCTGCMSCHSICPHHAISIIVDNEGFLRPQIDKKLCIDCGLCQRVCPVNVPVEKKKPLKVLSGWIKNEEIRLNSSSGGAFSAIALSILREKGVVFGVHLNEKLEAEHTFVESEEKLGILVGSKYVQSRIGNTYSETKLLLNQGRKVLFSGTPCQIAGLRRYLRKEYNNLILVDLICHGVPSPLIFDSYKKYIEETENMLIDRIRFRCKNHSWIFYNMIIDGHIKKNNSQKTYIGKYYDDPYIRGFLRDYFLRPCCSQCQYTSIDRVSDFTVADWWGYNGNTLDDKDYERRGVSLLFCNTPKAIFLFEKFISKSFHFKVRTIEEALRTNMSLSNAFPIPANRKEFWNDYTSLAFKDVIKKYMHPEKLNLSTRIKYECKKTFFRDFVLRVIYFYQKISKHLLL